MGLQIDVGDGSSAAPDMIMLAINPGDTVNVANNAASPNALNVFNAGIDAAPTTVAAGANANFTTQAWIQSTGGVCTVRITGGQYGS